MQAPADDKPRVLISQDAIAARVREIGAEVTLAHRDRELVVVMVLKGSFMFAADLVRAIDLPVTIDALGAQSYGNTTESSGEVRITSDLTHPIEGRDVLLVEDIVDTGLTLSFLLDTLGRRGPRSLQLAALLHKPSRARVPIQIDYLGFTIADEFVVGYGLDYAQRYRNLPYVGVLPKDVIEG